MKINFNKIFATDKVETEKKQNSTDTETFMGYVSKFKKLVKTIETMKYNSGRYGIENIKKLQKEAGSVEDAKRKLQHNLKELSNLPISVRKLLQEQRNMREKINKLNHENRKLFLRAGRNEITYEQVDYQRKINNKRIEDLQEKIDKNEAKMKKLDSVIEDLKNNVNSGLTEFKKGVTELEYKVEIIEKQMPPEKPVRAAPLSPIEVRDNLKDLAGYFNDYGAYEEGKQYLREKLDILSNFGIIENKELHDMHKRVNKSNATGQSLNKIIGTVIDKINRDLKSDLFQNW